MPFTILRHLSLAAAFLSMAPIASAEQPASTQRFALLAGVNEYEHDKLKALHFAENDVSALAVVLKAAKYQVTLLTGKADKAELKPTRANIEKQLALILQKCRKGDTVMVAFSGHGLQFEGDPDAFFCPADAKPFKDKTDTLVSIGKIYRELDASFATMKVLLVDACRDDPNATRGVSRGVNSTSAPPPPPGLAALFSCGAGEQSFESTKLEHGVFFYHVIEGMKGLAADGDREVTFSSLASYVSRRVRRDVADLVGDGAKQSPNLKADYTVEPVFLSARLTREEDDQLREDWSDYRQGMLKSQIGHDFFLAKGEKRKAIWRIAADLGDARAQVLIGRFLEYQDKKEGGAKAIALYQKAADQGEAEAMFELGVREQQDKKQMTDWFRRSAERGSPNGQYQFGLSLQDGRGIQKDEKAALEWIRKAADQDNLVAINAVGDFLANGIGTAKDETEAAKWYRKAAEAGFSNAQYSLAIMLDEGRGIVQDQTEAAKWYRILVRKNYVWTNYRLAQMLIEGIGVAKDEVEAVKWLRAAAEFGSADSQCYLAYMLEFGRGVEKNDAEAVRWYRKAVAQNHAHAMNNLGILVELGRGASKDSVEATRLFRKSAELNDVEGQYNLARAFEVGLGVQQNVNEAIVWYRKAAAQGHRRAKSELVRLGVEK